MSAPEAPGREEPAVVVSRSLHIVLPLPAHALTLNRRGGNPHARARQVFAHKGMATLAARATVPPEARPYFPAGVAVVAACRIERLARGKRWDFGAVIEALKPYFDGFNGAIWQDDRQLVAVTVEWDAKPTGTGLIGITLSAREVGDGRSR